jgi:hypothetical protein
MRLSLGLLARGLVLGGLSLSAGCGGSDANELDDDAQLISETGDGRPDDPNYEDGGDSAADDSTSTGTTSATSTTGSDGGDGDTGGPMDPLGGGDVADARVFGTGARVEVVDTIALTSGGWAVAVRFEGTATLASGFHTSAGQEDSAVLAYDAEGFVQWVKIFSSRGRASIVKLVELQGGDVVGIGEFTRDIQADGSNQLSSLGSSDLFAYRMLAVDGAILWSKSVGGTGPELMASAFPTESEEGGGAGDIIIVGSVSEDILDADSQPSFTLHGGEDALVVRIKDKDGEGVRIQAFGGPGDDVALGGRDVGDGTGDVIIVGSASDQADLGDTDPLSVAGQRDAFALRQSIAGVPVWSTGMGIDGVGEASLVLPPAASGGGGGGGAGDIIIVGSYNGTAGSDASTGTGRDALVATVEPMAGSVTGMFGIHADDIHPTAADHGEGTGDIIIVGSLTGTASPSGVAAVTSAGGEDGIMLSVDPLSGSASWATSFGGAGDDRPMALATSSSDPVVRKVGGYFEGNADFGGNSLDSVGARDGVWVELGAEGEVSDPETYLGRLGMTPDDLAVSSSGRVASVAMRGGEFEVDIPLSTPLPSDLLLTVWEADGEVAFQQVWSGALAPHPSAGYRGSEMGGSVVFGDDGSLVVCASFDDELRVAGQLVRTVEEKAGGVIVKLNADGSVAWVSEVAGNEDARVHDCALTPNGDVVFGGTLGELSTATVGGLVVDNESNTPGCLLGRVSGADGSGLWTQLETSTQELSCDSVAVRSDGRIFAALQLRGSATIGGESLSALGQVEAVLLAYDDDGSAASSAWLREFNGALDDKIWDLGVSSDGDVFAVVTHLHDLDIGGPESLPGLGSNTDSNSAVARFDGDNGELMWSHAFAGELEQELRHLAVGPGDVVVVSGRSRGNLDYGTWPLTGSEASDCAVAKYGANGELHWGRTLGAYANDEACSGVGVHEDGSVTVSGVLADDATMGGIALSPVGLFGGFLLDLDP